mmetsp:Transcript_3127/g.7671  ORF Transcript_3127/g.7671 Transcript_3127/m.7671 type:complete len:329 (-) Transcript_3127:714-1700(-)
MHLRGPNLDLEGEAALVQHHRVKALVTVRLGVLDVVLELALHRLPERVHKVEHLVALLLGLHDHPAGAQVVHLFEGEVLLLHLLVDAKDVLRPTVEVLAVDVTPGLDGLLEHIEVGLELLPLPRHEVVVHEALELVELGAVQVLEAEVLELGLDAPHAQSVGQGHEDVEGLLGDLPLLVGRKRPEGTHVVETVRQLYQHGAYVPHGQEHVLETVALGGGVVVPGAKLVAVEAAHLAHAAHADDHVRDARRDEFPELPLRHHGVVQDVVEQAGSDSLLVQAEVGQDVCRLDHVSEVYLLVPAKLAGVSTTRNFERKLHQRGTKNLVPLH